MLGLFGFVNYDIVCYFGVVGFGRLFFGFAFCMVSDVFDCCVLICCLFVCVVCIDWLMPCDCVVFIVLVDCSRVVSC